MSYEPHPPRLGGARIHVHRAHPSWSCYHGDNCNVLASRSHWNGPRDRCRWVRQVLLRSTLGTQTVVLDYLAQKLHRLVLDSAHQRHRLPEVQKSLSFLGQDFSLGGSFIEELYRIHIFRNDSMSSSMATSTSSL